ncbi:bifunctional 3-phosphoshikimate 1-carboxyvinyltransferase/cytidylate kinase [Caenimonas soli]|uniref:bifunctional 3-phosphoshikimate 1-carboxyvinyltransferase/cytidylate kinase n=1 Tax=Caenimonas soli TaxID=2735555 RepID=UPI001552358A|nr:bifunctional 3-phosphoshikimate 1-carboxyvinyltransferase/cytidylate kinase [Caenimonas soli]NPC55538.1 bifunctional 3-phosphoshikimate 1-carboxyvinyltransferase/cytidylate kinase [Caenimonas soli]
MFATEFLDIPPLDSAAGTVLLPGSKSISNRVLLLAALSAGTTTVHELLDSDDTRVMLNALRALGCGAKHSGKAVEITGLGGRAPALPARLFLGNAGTAMRPLTAALAVIGGEFELSGVARMHERPIGDLVDALRQLGCDIQYLGTEGYPPLRIGRPQLKLDRPIQVRGDVSSQFLTALLMALPLVAKQDVVIEVTGELISKPYIEITLNLLARFGITVRREGWQRFTIPAGSNFRSPGSIHVEADASSASYFVALGAIAAAQGQPLRVSGVGEDSIQGDIRFIDAARLMGAQVNGGPNSLEVSRGAWPLKAIDLDCNHIPDAAMTLAVMALYADGTTTLRNIASWRVKETDRLAAMAKELRKLGAEIVEGPDFITVTPPVQWKPASIHTYDDHRIAMCFSLAAFNPAGVQVRIEDPKCVGKTFPDYFETLFAVVQTPAPRIPVICVDGPTASGKGTLASQVAHRLGYHYLDSGALYRITAFAAVRAGLALDAAHEHSIGKMAETLPVRFLGGQVLLGEQDVTDAIRTEEAGMNASKVSALPAVRTALVALQQSFRRLPGLVADGRDMGTVIFPDAQMKVYLTASAAQRAERRHKQLISKGISTTIDALRADLEARDARDSSRAVAPLKPAGDALLLDNSSQSVDESVAQVLQWWEGKQPFGSAH